MSSFSNRALFWMPRLLSIFFIVFLSIFSLDVFAENSGFWQTARALAIHLIPSFVLIGVLVLAWRWEWIGAALFGAAGFLYIWWALTVTRPLSPAIRLNWCLTIAGPALLIAGLFLVNWQKHTELQHH